MAQQAYPDSKIHGANMGPSWVRSAPDGPHEPCYQGSYDPVHLGVVALKTLGLNSRKVHEFIIRMLRGGLINIFYVDQYIVFGRMDYSKSTVLKWAPVNVLSFLLTYNAFQLITECRISVEIN